MSTEQVKYAGQATCRFFLLLQAASETYEAAKDAAAGIAHGARGAARSAAGAGTVAKDMGGRAAGSASDAATDAYNSDTAKTAAVRPAATPGSGDFICGLPLTMCQSCIVTVQSGYALLCFTAAMALVLLSKPARFS